MEIDDMSTNTIQRYLEKRKEKEQELPKPYVEKQRHGEGWDVKVKDKDGEDWFLVRITEEGKLKRQCAIPTKLGYLLDSQSRLRIEGE